METTSIRFADAARDLGEEARRRGLVVPVFRSPPRCAGSSRSIRRRNDGGATVSVALRGRPWPAVLADLIEGVIVANRLEGGPAATARDGLWEAVVGSAAGSGIDGASAGTTTDALVAAAGPAGGGSGSHAGVPGRDGRRLAAA